MSKAKYNQALIALEKIAQVLGEEEYKDIVDLSHSYNTKIMEEEIGSLRNYYMWMWIVKPFSLNDYANEKKRIEVLIPSHSNEKYVRKIKKDNEVYIKCAEKIEIWRVHDEVLVELKDGHDIKNGDLTDQEWETLIKTEQWKKAEVQMARVLVAFNIYSKKRSKG